MKKIVLLLICLLSMVFEIGAQTTKTVGPGGDYTTLKAAFDAVNSGNITGTIILQLIGNTSETASAVLYQSGYGGVSNCTSLKIYPTESGITISGSLAAPLIDLNGADNVIIDGRVNATGSTNDLIIKNTNTSSTAGTSTIRWIATAQTDTVQYCNLRGSSTATTGGIIYFATASAGTGNSYNSVTNCDITNEAENRPVNAIFSLGSSGYVNTNNTISNNMIYDFLNAGASSNAVNISSYSTAFTVSANSFYETSNPFAPTAGNTYNIIRINNTSGNDFSITGNYIGGRAVSCGGSAFTVNGNYTHTFQAIYLSVGTTGVSSLQNNYIKNINYTSTSAAAWCGIYVNAGTVNIGTTYGNTIGETTGNNSISLTNTSSNSISYGIYVNSSGTLDIENNVIGSVTTTGSASYSHSFFAIYKFMVIGTWTVNNNTIGSTTTSNSIQAISSSTSTVGQIVTGIRSLGTVTSTISGNTIANLYNAYAGGNTSSRTRGIDVSDGSNTIQNNTIRNLTSTSGQEFYNVAASVIGISQSSTLVSATQTISGNTIYSLLNTNATAKVDVYGIYFGGATSGTNTISNNFIHSLSLSSSNITSSIMGILTYTGASTITNNIINFGGGISAGIGMYGLFDQSGSGNNNLFYFNTVYIGGTVSGTTSSTYAFYNIANTSTRDYRNNVLQNARTGGSTGKHYAIYIPNSTALTINYNDYYVSAGGTLGKIGSTNYTALDAAWKTASGGDANSVNVNPGFMIAGSTTPSDYMPASTLAGLAGFGITLDILGVSRPAVPTMGAVERGPFWIGSISTDFNNSANWSNNVVPISGANIFFADDPDRSCYLDVNRTIGALVINQSTDKFILNGHQLNVNGTLSLTNGGQIDATTASSSIVFAGIFPQSIPAGTFVNDQVLSLTINNSTNVTLFGTLKFLGNLIISSGLLDAYTNNPTVEYGSDSDQTISSGIYLDNKIYNLTVNNANLLTLNTNFTINNNLVINSGNIFELSAGKTLTVSGTITNSAGNAGFILQSDTTGTAALINNTNSVSATVKRYVTGNAEAWHFMSSPVSAQSISGSWIPSGTYGNGTGYDLYLWNEPNSCWIYKLDSTSTINWNTVHSGANFSVGRGYLYSVQATNPTKEFAGYLNNGNLNYALTFSSENLSLKGFNLVGNPYPSSIDWKAASGWTRTKLTSSGGGYDMWIWNPTANNYGVYNSADADGIGTNSVTRYIAPMQGYFVQASSAGNLSLTNSVRVLNGANDWLKNFNQENSEVSLCVKSVENFGSDEIQIKFGYLQNENGAMKLFSKVISAPSLYLCSNTKNYSVSYFTDTKENTVVPIGFTAGADGNYTFVCNFDLSKFEIVMLEDRLTHNILDLKSANSYSFYASKNDDAKRFVLYFGPIENPVEKELPAKIYSDNNHLIIDLTLVAGETDLCVYDVMGRLILQQKLQAKMLNNINFNSKTQILIVSLKNPNGMLCRKIGFGF